MTSKSQTQSKLSRQDVTHQQTQWSKNWNPKDMITIPESTPVANIRDQTKCIVGLQETSNLSVGWVNITG